MKISRDVCSVGLHRSLYERNERGCARQGQPHLARVRPAPQTSGAADAGPLADALVCGGAAQARRARRAQPTAPQPHSATSRGPCTTP
jgi:hypothetical protein